MLKHITALYDQRVRGVGLTGQPGIGKKCAAYGKISYNVNRKVYISISCSHGQDPQRQDNYFSMVLIETFLFRGHEDVTVYNARDWIDPEGDPGVWALSDTNVEVVTPRDE